mmetsp:Transcript_3511/g.6727  ORF Transcript_3511/g.6727 Transcript_3511/m.6727 type:complete len:771 (-) Transcript_3511:14-2326(-)
MPRCGVSCGSHCVLATQRVFLICMLCSSPFAAPGPEGLQDCGSVGTNLDQATFLRMAASTRARLRSAKVARHKVLAAISGLQALRPPLDQDLQTSKVGLQTTETATDASQSAAQAASREYKDAAGHAQQAEEDILRVVASVGVSLNKSNVAEEKAETALALAESLVQKANAEWICVRHAWQVASEREARVNRTIHKDQLVEETAITREKQTAKELNEAAAKEAATDAEEQSAKELRTAAAARLASAAAKERSAAKAMRSSQLNMSNATYLKALADQEMQDALRSVEGLDPGSQKALSEAFAKLDEAYALMYKEEAKGLLGSGRGGGIYDNLVIYFLLYVIVVLSVIVGYAIWRKKRLERWSGMRMAELEEDTFKNMAREEKRLSRMWREDLWHHDRLPWLSTWVSCGLCFAYGWIFSSLLCARTWEWGLLALLASCLGLHFFVHHMICKVQYLEQWTLTRASESLLHNWQAIQTSRLEEFFKYNITTAVKVSTGFGVAGLVLGWLFVDWFEGDGWLDGCKLFCVFCISGLIIDASYLGLRVHRLNKWPTLRMQHSMASAGDEVARSAYDTFHTDEYPNATSYLSAVMCAICGVICGGLMQGNLHCSWWFRDLLWMLLLMIALFTLHVHTQLKDIAYYQHWATTRLGIDLFRGVHSLFAVNSNQKERDWFTTPVICSFICLFVGWFLGLEFLGRPNFFWLQVYLAYCVIIMCVLLILSSHLQRKLESYTSWSSVWLERGGNKAAHSLMGGVAEEAGHFLHQNSGGWFGSRM